MTPSQALLAAFELVLTVSLPVLLKIIHAHLKAGRLRDLVDTVIEDAIGYADEKGHQFFVANATKMDSSAKLDAAVGFAGLALKGSGLVPSSAALASWIEARLGLDRDPDPSAA